MTLGKTLLSGLLVALILLAGCDRPPDPPMLDGKRVTAIETVDQAEQAAAQRATDAYARYELALMTLEGYYDRIGQHTKREWARKELKNLRTARTYVYVGVEPAPLGSGPDLSQTSEPQLAETVLVARREFLDAVEALVEQYRRSGADFKARLASNILERFDLVRTYSYYGLLDAEVPGPELRPTRVDPDAERLFAEAYSLYKAGRIGPALTDYNKERQALLKFLRLVEKHRDSTRIAEAAYYIGFIYKEYFNENMRGALWLERAFQWDPNIPLPAYYEAAVVTDLRLHNRSRALELWRLVLKHDANGFHQSYAQERIAFLSGQAN